MLNRIYQHEVLDLIKPQRILIHTYGVMRYKNGFAVFDDIPPDGGWYAKPAAWIKKQHRVAMLFFGGE